jgi:hypothetical protein
MQREKRSHAKQALAELKLELLITSTQTPHFKDARLEDCPSLMPLGKKALPSREALMTDT